MNVVVGHMRSFGMAAQGLADGVGLVSCVCVQCVLVLGSSGLPTRGPVLVTKMAGCVCGVSCAVASV